MAIQIIFDNTTVRLSADIAIKGRDYFKLLRYLTGRLAMAAQRRNQFIELYKDIDREYYGYLRRDQDDKKRDRDNKRGIGIKPVDEKLSMIFAQLDEATTYLLNVLAPDEAIYTAQAPAEQQKVASGFAALMNKHAEKYHHYRHLALFLQTALRYNLGAFSVTWVETFGNVISKKSVTSGERVTKRERIFHGNALEAFDIYNLLLDPSVNPVDVAEKGQFYSYVTLETPFRLKKAAADNDYQRVEDFLQTQTAQFSYFQEHPVTRDDYAHSQGVTDWVSIFNATEETKDAAEMREQNAMLAWIIPADFGISKITDYQIWQFIIGGSTHILHAKHLENSHGMLPINIAVPFEDHFQLDAKGAAERLIPHQRFASFILNVHQRAVRKKLYGLTIFDSQVIPLLDSTDIDMAGGKVAASGLGIDVDLRKKIIQFNDAPDTTRSLENIQIMNDLMQGVMPTNIQNQVAGLERATQYQAAALVQGANRRNLKMAKIINAQAMDSSRFQQMQNIFEKQDSVRIIGPQGKLIDIDPNEFLDADIEFTIADGLKGLDRLALTMNMKDLFASVLQSTQATQQLDVLKLMDYMSTMFGDYTDFIQFKLESPIDALSVEERNLAFQLLQKVLEEQGKGTLAANVAGTNV